ncbi:hypothetical protein OIV83_000504 [Microbotryomycetes sp. JL201]|nr:hypothetical protein OIV83_000504 [Microbotryomycetes sp. JL201]
MVHATKPSVDLEGGGDKHTRTRRRSALTLRSPNAMHAPQNAQPLSIHVHAPPSPSSPASVYASPYLGSPDGDAPGFSTLPPSPTTLSPAMQRSSSSSSSTSSSYTQSASQIFHDASLPNSAPTSPRFAADVAFDLGISGVGSPWSDADGNSVNLSVPQIKSSPGTNTSNRIKKRPSFIITKPPSNDSIQGLNIDMGLSSAGLPTHSKRSFADAVATPLPPSPLLPPGSTLPSPTFAPHSPSLLSPNSPHLSATPMDRAPSSPRLAAFTDPIGRLATGLVRKASATSLKEDLPTAVKRSPVPSSPALTSPSLSPNLLGGEWSSSTITQRRTGVAKDARAKEKEKTQERKKHAAEQKRNAIHNRMFSWALRPEDMAVMRKDTNRPKRSDSKRRSIFMFGILMTVLIVCFSTQSTKQPRRSSPPTSMTKGPRPAAFIHPEVIERRSAPLRASGLSSMLGWLGVLVHVRGSSAPSETSFRSRASSLGFAPKSIKSGMSIAPHVAYNEHRALPPPLEHSDAPERDTLVLYRILGNDLPPRHSAGQTLRNLAFMLQHESDFSLLPPLGPHKVHHSHAYGSGSKNKNRHQHSEFGGLRVDKYFVLNRIADQGMVNAIISLLQLYSVPQSRILVIPFEWEEYQRREFRWDGGVDAVPGWGVGHERWHEDTPEQPWQPPQPGQEWEGQIVTAEESQRMAKRHDERRTLARLRALDWVYHEKNLYAMNNNGGRNFALHHGRSLPHARWILPLDGNSFLTPAAMHSIVRTLSISGEGPYASRYLIIPMARLLNNNDIKANNSISLVPRDHSHEGSTAEADAEANHRTSAAPETPEEPQIGFRYDSTEDFQEAMRYGRRSKLELLWRLGAIPYSRGLDRRTMPWEFADRHHVTAESWGSIPGAQGTPTNSPVHQPHYAGEIDDNGEPNPHRGPLAFAKAGWVHRLFSGHASQERRDVQAVTLRNVNRIKGIIDFLEKLDDRVARGQDGCLSHEEDAEDCGFSADRLWHFDMDALAYFKTQLRAGEAEAVKRVDQFENLIQPGLRLMMKASKGGWRLNDLDATWSGLQGLQLAVAAYLTGNSTYSEVATDMIANRFVKQIPLYYRATPKASVLPDVDELAEHIVSENGNGYVFPPPLPENGQAPVSWNAAMGQRVSAQDVPQLPFEPLQFDPTYLLDAVRLLTDPDVPQHDATFAASRKALRPMFVAHLNYLLYHPVAVSLCRHPESPEDGAHYDAKLAALAAYLDDTRLLTRIANRARLRLPSHRRSHDGLLDHGGEIREVHWRLVHGLRNIRFRPYSVLLSPLGDGAHYGSAHGMETPLDVLGLTPGTGKTTLSAQLVEALQQHDVERRDEHEAGLPKWEHVNVGDDWVKAKECHTGWNEQWQSWDVDEDKLLDELEPFQTSGGKVFDWHCCDIFPERWIDLVVVLRCDHSKLWDRLEKRGYPLNKIQENNTAEIMNVVLDDARESYVPEIVVELESESPDQVEDNIARIVQWVDAWRKDHTAE